MIAFVAVKAWPTFAHNGLSWLGPGGNTEHQIGKMLYTRASPTRLGLSPQRLAADLTARC